MIAAAPISCQNTNGFHSYIQWTRMYTESSRYGNPYTLYTKRARGAEMSEAWSQIPGTGAYAGCRVRACTYMGAVEARNINIRWAMCGRLKWKQCYRPHIAFEACEVKSIRDESTLAGGSIPWRRPRQLGSSIGVFVLLAYYLVKRAPEPRVLIQSSSLSVIVEMQETIGSYVKKG